MAGKKYDNSTNVINKVSLKLNDELKELEYNTLVKDRKRVQFSVKLIYVLLALYSFLFVEQAIYLLWTNSRDKDSQGKSGTETQTSFSDNSKLLYIYLCQIIAAGTCAYLILKSKDIPAYLVMFVYIVIINLLMCVQVLYDASNSLCDFTFFIIVSFSFVSRQYAVYLIGLITFVTVFTFATARLDYIYDHDRDSMNSTKLKLDLVIQIFNLFFILLLWVAYAYQDELS